MAIPLSIINDNIAIITPNKAKYTQSSPNRANVFCHTHDKNLRQRLERFPNNS